MPQTTRTGNVAMGNQKTTKSNMYYTNFHHANHNVEPYRHNKKEELTIATTKVTIQAGKPPRPLNCPCHICGIVRHKLRNYPIW